MKTARAALSLVAWALADQVMGTKALCVSPAWPTWASLSYVWSLTLTAGLSSMASYSSVGWWFPWREAMGPRWALVLEIEPLEIPLLV